MDYSNFENKILENYKSNKKNTNVKIENVIIDSRDRNTSLYSNPANYMIELPTEYKCVQKIELVNSYVVGSCYNIVKNYNDTLYITESSPISASESVYSSTHSKYPNGVYTTSTNKLKLFNRSSYTAVVIPAGCYSEVVDGYSEYKYNNAGSSWTTQTHSTVENNASLDTASENVDIPINSLAREIAIQLSKTIVDNVYTVKYDSKTNKYTISRSGGVNFHLLFFDNEEAHGHYRTEYDSHFSFPLHNSTQDLTKYFKTEKERTNYILDSEHGFTKTTGGSVTASDATVGSSFNSGSDTIFVSPPTRKSTFYGDMERKYPVQVTNNTTIKGGSIGKVLGFDNYNLSNNTTYTGQKCADLVPEPYILLKIPQLKRFQSLNRSAHKSFAIIPLDKTHLTEFDINSNIKSFYKPLAKLDRMTIHFIRRDGSTYDFCGKEHRLVFKITTSRQSDKYCT